MLCGLCFLVITPREAFACDLHAKHMIGVNTIAMRMRWQAPPRRLSPAMLFVGKHRWTRIEAPSLSFFDEPMHVSSWQKIPGANGTDQRGDQRPPPSAGWALVLGEILVLLAFVLGARLDPWLKLRQWWHAWGQRIATKQNHDSADARPRAPWLDRARHMMYESRLLMAQGEPLRVAKQMQQSILPMTWPDDERHALYGYTTHLGDVVGDFYDHITVPGQPLNLLIGCVNGTGTTATLLSMMAKTQYREQVALMDQLNRPDLLLSGMIQAFSSPHDSPWTIKGVCASYDSHTGILRWSVAGNMLGLRIDAQGKIIPLQDTQGLALGLQVQDHYPMHTVQIQAGEQVLWMTSAWGHVPVARNIDSASKGLQSLIQTPPQVHGPALIERIAWACDESMRSALPRRGLSCLLLHRKA